MSLDISILILLINIHGGLLEREQGQTMYDGD
jgi:hypothetical protein